MREARGSRHRHVPVLVASKAGKFSLSSILEGRRVGVRACGRLVLGHGAHDTVWASHLDLKAGTHVSLDLSSALDASCGVDETRSAAAEGSRRGCALRLLRQRTHGGCAKVLVSRDTMRIDWFAHAFIRGA
jgi:hypothetical protein